MRFISTFKIVVLFVAMMFLSILQGCSSKVDGDVYIRAKGGTANKLALVNIFAVPIKDLEHYENATSAKAEKIKAEVLASIPSSTLKSLYSEHVALLEEASRLQHSEYEAMASGRGSFDSGRKKLQDKLYDNKQTLEMKLLTALTDAKVNDSYARLNSIAPIAFYQSEIAPLLNGAQVVKTVSDADGKFTLELPRGDYVLVGIDGDRSLWLVKINSKENKVTLSDANAFDSGCTNCLVKTVDKSVAAGGSLSMAVYVMSEFANGNDRKIKPLFEYAKKAGLI
jgi:hypothetical protein